MAGSGYIYAVDARLELRQNHSSKFVVVRVRLIEYVSYFHFPVVLDLFKIG